MNRRTLLQRLAAGAAGLLGVGMVAPKAEAAEGFCGDNPEIAETEALMSAMLADPDKYPELWAHVREITGKVGAEQYERGRAIAEVRIESRLAEGLPIGRDALTFEDMAADCAARGCSLDAMNVAFVQERFVTHKTDPTSRGAISQYFMSGDSVAIDAWRRSLHGTG